ncbi:hypothetical protein [Duncaniella dubosii]|uniref:hypothetical protein n=1 Tax=Duncaniella dubosii TaxID=2518971 RepID=UPI003F662DC3
MPTSLAGILTGRSLPIYISVALAANDCNIHLYPFPPQTQLTGVTIQPPPDMSRNLLARYMAHRYHQNYGAITREKAKRTLDLSPYSEETPMPRTLSITTEPAIEELFNINIECNPTTYEYYIDSL